MSNYEYDDDSIFEDEDANLSQGTKWHDPKAAEANMQQNAANQQSTANQKNAANQQNAAYQQNTAYQKNAAYQKNDSEQQDQRYQYENYAGNGYYNYGKKQYPKGHKPGNALGVLSLIFGIIALLIFATTLNIFFGIIAIVCGIIQCLGHEKKGLAIGGIVTSCISFVLMIIFYALVLNSPKFMDAMEDYVQNFDIGFYYNYDTNSEDSLQNLPFGDDELFETPDEPIELPEDSDGMVSL